MYDNEKMLLKLCDFGSAKKIISGEDSISYIGFLFVYKKYLTKLRLYLKEVDFIEHLNWF